MTRIKGFLEGPTGPLNGRLFVRASSAFIGAPEGEQAFRVENGEVDIQLPPTPARAPYMVDWRNIGDTRKLSFPERWLVPNAEEVELDQLRGYKTEVLKKQRALDKASATELVVVKAENETLQNALEESKAAHQQALKRLSSIETQLAAAMGKAASAEADFLQEQAANYRRKLQPIEQVEKIVERKVAIGHEELREMLAAETERRVLLEQENSSLQKQLTERLSLANHFGALHAEIDRLNLEKQQLLARIEGLKTPRRSASSYRTEAIAELDQLIGA